jgi:hypothetical protein
MDPWRRAREHSGSNGGGSDGSGVSSQSISLFLSFSISCSPKQIGNTSMRKAKGRGVQGKRKTIAFKRGEDGAI